MKTKIEKVVLAILVLILAVVGSAEVYDSGGRQSVNLAAIAGTVTSVSNGAVGNGVQRVTIANDSTGQVKVLGQNSVNPIYCTSVAFLDMATATTTQIVALSGSTVVYVCSYAFQAGGTTAVKLVGGTGANCVTSQSARTPNYDFTAQAGINRVGGGGNIVAKGVAADALCVTSSTAVNVHAEVSYAQF